MSHSFLSPPLTDEQHRQALLPKQKLTSLLLREPLLKDLLQIF